MQIRESDLQFEKTYPSHEAAKAIDWIDLRSKRQSKFREVLKNHNFDALLLTDTENARYVSDIRPVHSVSFTSAYQAILTPDELFLIAPAGDIPRIESQMPWIDATYQSRRADMAGVYQEIFRSHDISEVGVDSLDFSIANELKGITAIGDRLAEERAVKFPEEIGLLDDAGAVCEVGVLAALDAIEQGVHEYEVAAEAEYAVKKAGAQGVSWNPATFSGTNTGIFLRYDSSKRLRYGDFVILGYAFNYQGYNMDMNVTTVVGEPSEEQQEMYTAVWDAKEAAHGAIEAGVDARTVRDAAAAVIEERGFGNESFVDYQPIFHGLGMNVYEPPFAPDAGADLPNHTLKPGHVIVPEPGVFDPENPSRGGVRIGGPVLVTENGCEQLAHVVPDRHEDLYIGDR